MTRDEVRRIISQSVAIIGNEALVKSAIEEMGELTAAINHHRLGRCSTGDVIEEIAEVAITMSQLALIYGKDRYDSAIMRKLILLKELVDK